MNKASTKAVLRWGIVAIIVCGGAFMAYNTFVPQPNEELTQAQAPKGGRNKTLSVRAVVVAPQDLTDAITISGSLLANEEANLAFETSGKITHIYFEEGQFAKKGQLLAKLNDATLQANLKRLQAKLQLTTDRLHRQKTLLEKEAVSQEAFQQAEVDLQTLEAEIEQVQAQIMQTELRAPFDGTIGLRQVSLGEFVNTSQAVASITATDPIKIEFAVPERYAAHLQIGDPIGFVVEGDLKQRKAVVYATDSKVNTNTRTLNIRAKCDNRDGQLIPGRYVQVTLTAQKHIETLAVPAEAIISEMGVDKVYLYKSGVAEPVVVKKGLRTATDVQIISGLNPGDTVLTSGIMQLRMGTKVKITGYNRP